MTPAKPSGIVGVLSFARYVLGASERRAGPAALFLILGSLTEGLSILLLVPLLTLLGPGATSVAIPIPELLTGRPGVTVGMGLATALILLTSVITAQALLMRAKTLYMADLLVEVVDRLRINLFSAIGGARWRFLSARRHSDLHQALTSEIDRVHVSLNHLLALLQTLVILLIYTGISLIISPTMTLVASGVGLSFLALLTPLRRRSSVYGTVVTAQKQRQLRTVDAFLGGLKVVKSLTAEPRYVRRLDNDLSDARNEFHRYMGLASLAGALFQILSALGVSLFVWIALTIMRVPMAQLIVMIFLFMRIAPRFTAIQSHLQELMTNLEGFHQVQRLTQACREEAEPDQGRASALPLKEMLTFHNVSFRYAEGQAEILSGLFLAVPARRITALIGPSGGGKSTIGDLILGLLEPDAGQICIDGVPLDSQAIRAWRRSVAYVPQDVFLMHDTIRENLRIALPGADEAAMWRALDMAQAGDFVRLLDFRLDTVVGPRGTRLSGGERQRIALARALLMEPQLLILDEATSALDWENQGLIAKAIEGLRGRMTVITIAHRPSMISFADWVLAIDGGRLVEAGAYRELRASPASVLSRMMDGENGQVEREPDRSMIFEARHQSVV
ncbi:ABC transporter ATP-binding protein [Brevundimonas nasdae]|uniref:ABC transporter ATP-binding protein n=1 Tax=Brevundimonas nasdae TaxID=172043 RepID=UPI00068EC016|nr:ABC transporter ATP-binding protein [Brevundimonas nasdae]